VPRPVVKWCIYLTGGVQLHTCAVSACALDLVSDYMTGLVVNACIVVHELSESRGHTWSRSAAMQAVEAHLSSLRLDLLEELIGLILRLLICRTREMWTGRIQVIA
jgi:hypothetical protein